MHHVQYVCKYVSQHIMTKMLLMLYFYLEIPILTIGSVENLTWKL